METSLRWGRHFLQPFLSSAAGSQGHSFLKGRDRLDGRTASADLSPLVPPAGCLGPRGR